MSPLSPHWQVNSLLLSHQLHEVTNHCRADMHGKGPVCLESRRKNKLPLPENAVLKCKKGSYKHTEPMLQSDEQNIPGNTCLGVASSGKCDSRVLERGLLRTKPAQSVSFLL